MWGTAARSTIRCLATEEERAGKLDESTDFSVRQTMSDCGGIRKGGFKGLSDSGAHLSSLGHEEQRGRLGASTLLHEACTMPSPRYTVRLPELLHTHVQASLETTRPPFGTLIREALSAYLADKMPTGIPLCADSTDPLTALHAHGTDFTARVKVIEEILTAWSQRADRKADRPRASRAQPTPARGQRTLTPRQQRALRDTHLRGVPVAALQEEYGLSKPTVLRSLRSLKR